MSGRGATSAAWGEAALGALVLAAAVAFFAYGFHAAGLRRSSDTYPLVARFGDVGGLAAGAPVRVAGVKVGAVRTVILDPHTYMAVARIDIDRSVRLPSDSTARIASDGLLGGPHLAITPGGAMTALEEGGEIENTQGAVDIFGLIGQVMRPASAAGVDGAASDKPTRP
jgi:phospholipid/cholesterol/gamma-HCH transport system substrate-binding protein